MNTASFQTLCFKEESGVVLRRKTIAPVDKENAAEHFYEVSSGPLFACCSSNESGEHLGEFTATLGGVEVSIPVNNDFFMLLSLAAFNAWEDQKRFAARKTEQVEGQADGE